MNQQSNTDQQKVDEAYRNYIRAQIVLWTNRIRDAKERLAEWQLQLHNADNQDSRHESKVG